MAFINPNSPSAALFLTDAYKLGHRQQYPEGTEYVYSNYTNRGTRIKNITHVIHFGLQAFIQDVLMDSFASFFAADEDAVAEDYEKKVTALLGPNTVGSDHIRALHRKGFIPLRFRAVPEGTPVPLRVPSFTVENTDPEFFWLTNYIETAMSAAIWQASTSATIAWDFRKLLDAKAEATSSNLDAVNFQGHDFSFRGMAGISSAAASGAGHLLSFLGTDSLVSLDWIDYFYPGENGFVGGSVPATEHAVMCAGGQDNELETYDRLITTYPTGYLSVVSDTWDFLNVLTNILPQLKDKIMARDGRLVIRPDSGDPVDIICGSVPANGLLPNGTPAQRGAIELLHALFGGTTNEKGFIELDPHIGLIYGDSITKERAEQITARLAAKGFASTNVVFGVGSYTYQYQTRDTFMSAIKATWVQILGEGKNIMKNPVTDNGTKKSATGRLALTRGDNGIIGLIEQANPQDEAASLLELVWENGHFVKKQSFANIREVLQAETKILNLAGV